MVYFSDRCRTAGNLYSQNLCVAITQKFAGLETQETDSQGTDDIEIVVNDAKNAIKSNNDVTELTTVDESQKLIKDASKSKSDHSEKPVNGSSESAAV